MDKKEIIELTTEERTAKGNELLRLLDTTPMYIFDIVSYKIENEYRLHPLLVECLLSKRGQFDGRLSIRENLEKHYGKHAAELAEELI